MLIQKKRKKRRIRICGFERAKIKKERKRNYSNIKKDKYKIIHGIKILLNSSNRIVRSLVFELISITRQTKAFW